MLMLLTHNTPCFVSSNFWLLVCLYRVVAEPTHFSVSSCSLIDLVFLSSPTNLVSCTTIPALANSDHLGLSLPKGTAAKFGGTLTQTLTLPVNYLTPLIGTHYSARVMSMSVGLTGDVDSCRSWNSVYLRQYFVPAEIFPG